jgi:hypothetical protein
MQSLSLGLGASLKTLELLDRRIIAEAVDNSA